MRVNISLCRSIYVPNPFRNAYNSGRVKSFASIAIEFFKIDIAIAARASRHRQNPSRPIDIINVVQDVLMKIRIPPATGVRRVVLKYCCSPRFCFSVSKMCRPESCVSIARFFVFNYPGHRGHERREVVFHASSRAAADFYRKRFLIPCASTTFAAIQSRRTFSTQNTFGPPSVRQTSGVFAFYRCRSIAADS